MFEPGDPVRFPDPTRRHAIVDGTFVERGDRLIEVQSRAPGVPPRQVESAVVRRADGTTAFVIYAWIRPA